LAGLLPLEKAQKVLHVITNHGQALTNAFTVIQKDTVRIRPRNF
jgi:hypothetical protein